MFNFGKKKEKPHTWNFIPDSYFWRVVESNTKYAKIQRFYKMVSFDAPEDEQYKVKPCRNWDEGVYAIIPIWAYQVDQYGSVLEGEQSYSELVEEI